MKARHIISQPIERQHTMASMLQHHSNELVQARLCIEQLMAELEIALAEATDTECKKAKDDLAAQLTKLVQLLLKVQPEERKLLQLLEVQQSDTSFTQLRKEDKDILEHYARRTRPDTDA